MPFVVAPRRKPFSHPGLRRSGRRPQRRAQKGVTIVVTLILLVVMLMGGLALARLTEVSTLAAGNAAYHEAAVQASEPQAVWRATAPALVVIVVHGAPPNEPPWHLSCSSIARQGPASQACCRLAAVFARCFT